jgi:hypothetical protein
MIVHGFSIFGKHHQYWLLFSRNRHIILPLISITTMLTQLWCICDTFTISQLKYLCASSSRKAVALSVWICKRRLDNWSTEILKFQTSENPRFSWRIRSLKLSRIGLDLATGMNPAFLKAPRIVTDVDTCSWACNNFVIESHMECSLKLPGVVFAIFFNALNNQGRVPGQDIWNESGKR